MLSAQQSRTIKIVSLCTLLFFSLIVLKVFISSRSEYQRAEAAIAKADPLTALTHYERAILWYLPIGGYVEPSASAIWQIATDLESQGEKKDALNAYRSLRSAFIAARSFYTPGLDWIARSEEKIAVLMAAETVYSEADRKKSLEQKTAEALAILRRPMKPNTFWSIMVVVGFLGWASGTLMFIWKAFREGTTKIRLKPGILWGSVVVVFYALWIIGMTKA